MSEECIDKKCPTGIPAWVMTFADLMSLLLAFFVLLFSFSEMDKNIYKEMAGSMKEAFGVQREIVVKEPPKGINIVAREFSPGRPDSTPFNEVRQSTTNDYKQFPVFTDPGLEGQESQKQKPDAASRDLGGIQQTGLEQVERIQVDSEAIREQLEDEIEKGLIQLEVKENGIILRIRENASFPSGSEKLIKPFSNIAAKIGSVFKDFEGEIIVSGHTDTVPINTYKFRSNWELSSSRAVSVLHALSKDENLADKRFQVAAYADTKPVESNKTAAGRATNRRVEILMDYSHAPDNAIDDSLSDGSIEDMPHVNVPDTTNGALPGDSL